MDEAHFYFDSEAMWECTKCYALAKQSLWQVNQTYQLMDIVPQAVAVDPGAICQTGLAVANLDHHGIQDFWPSVACLTNLSQFIKKGGYYVHYYYYSTMKECRKCYKIASSIQPWYNCPPPNFTQIQANFLDVANLYHRNLKHYWATFYDLTNFEDNYVAATDENGHPLQSGALVHYYEDNGQKWVCDVCAQIAKEALAQLDKYIVSTYGSACSQLYIHPISL